MNPEDLKSDIINTVRSEYPEKGEHMIEEGVAFKIEDRRLLVSVSQSPIKPFQLYEKLKPNGDPGVSLKELRRVGEIVREVGSEQDVELNISQTDPMMFTGKTKTYVLTVRAD